MRSTDCLQTARNLGNLGFKQGLWEIAIEGYKKAIEAVENIRSWATKDDRREEIQAQAIEIYSNIIQSYINLNQYDKAMEYVERSRSRRLVELMYSNDLYGDAEIPERVKSLLEQYEAKQQSINEIFRFLQSDDNRVLTEAREFRGNRAYIDARRAEISQLERQKQQIWLAMRQLDPILASQQKVDSLDFSSMQSLISDRPHTAILCIYSTNINVHIFVLRHTGQPEYFHCADINGIGIGDLNTWLYESWLMPYLSNQEQWQKDMPKFLGDLAQTLQIDRLINKHLQNIKELILIPHLYLHQIPFAALPITPLANHQEAFLGDRFKIRYIPSTQVLKFCSDRKDISFANQIPNFSSVEDATEDLMFAAFEGSHIAAMLQIDKDRRLQGKQGATTAAYVRSLKISSGMLSSHHGKTRLDSPLESMLLLGDGAITLGQLLVSRYPQLGDIFLSCCETGLGIPKSITDDIVTLGSGFLYAGARSVISSLWAVNDFATMIFSILYHQERKAGSDRMSALQSAQQEIREMTRLKLYNLAQEWNLQPYLDDKIDEAFAAKQQAEQLAKQTPTPESIAKEKAARAAEDNLNTINEWIQKPKNREAQQMPPFTSPYYWAAFTCQGLG